LSLVDQVATRAEYHDRVRGITERFLTPVLGGGSTVAVLTTPREGSSSIGWVICHSLGLEQQHLVGFDAALGRDLAAAGMPAIRFHGQGYGDSELGEEHVSLRSHVVDASDASRVLVREAGVTAVGLVGSRFGAATALLTADEIGASAVALVDPVVRGRKFIDSLIRSGLAVSLDGTLGGHPPDPMKALERDGSIEVQGFLLRQDLFRDVAAMDLTRGVHAFRGKALVVQVSRGSEARGDIKRLVECLLNLGADVTLDVHVDPEALKFGQPRYRFLAIARKSDSIGDLADRLVARVVRWSGTVALTSTVGTT